MILFDIYNNYDNLYYINICALLYIIIMDVVYHRNCLDGTYSAYLLYLLSKSITI